ncbi:hypothetical protein ABD91_01725 [Lysinibacillus sphaericus]|uniref:hypothetical protein n=1 Tax=Lysinibacillus sphaericus TaxID=1421 RepID=UPI0018CFCB4C|nr:hypothetical protein [Lysinibacillus sphaericus]MBG9689648.1 hypothetical protein [Lysinibacillus sphaericus]
MGAISDKLVDIFSKLIEAIFDFILEPFLGLSDLKDLIFGDSEEKYFIWNTFSENVYTYALNPLYSSMLVFSILIMAFLVVIFGMKTAMTFHRPQGRIEFIHTGLTIFLVIFLLSSLQKFYDIAFSLNYLIVQWLGSGFESTVASLKDVDTEIGNPIGRVIVELVLVGLSVWGNFYYQMRAVTLVILLVLGPIFVVLMINPRLRGLTHNWWKETASTIFVQSIHAVVFFILNIFSMTEENIISAVICIIVFIPVSVGVRGLFGLSLGLQDNVSKAGAALGMTTLFALGGAVKGAMNGKSIGEIAKGTFNGAKDRLTNGRSASSMGDIKESVAGNENSDLAADRKAERLLRNGETLKAIGRGAFGIAGALAFSGNGSRGAITGAGLGYLVGGEAAGFAGRAGTAAMDSLKSRKDKMNKLLGPQSLGEKSLKDDIDSSADALAEVDAHEWANQNKDSILKDLQSRFPDANQNDLESMLDQEVLTRKAELKTKYLDELSSAVSYGETHVASGDNFKNQATDNLIKAWEKENQPTFNKEYEQQHPRRENESLEDFEQRRDAEFANRKAGVSKSLKGAVGDAMAGSTNEIGDINKAMFNSKLASGLQTLASTDPNVAFNNPEAAALLSTKDIQSASIISPNNRLMSGNVGQILAQQATMKERSQYIDNAIARGNTAEEAVATWNTEHATKALANNVDKYKHVNASIDKAVALDNNVLNAVQNPSFSDKVRAFAASTTTETSTAFSNVANVVRNGADKTIATWVANKVDGVGVLQNVVNSVQSGATSAIETFTDQAVETHGSYVQAQDDLTRTAGYVGGIFLGRAGHRMARNMTTKFSPLNDGVQSEINSAQEVIQMAQTATDSFGNSEVVPGAIRQVVTSDSSYVEVLTRSGERKIVSRMSGGHANLEPNAVVYQDLSMQDGMLVPTTRGSSSTYRLSEDGSVIPSDITIQQNPNALLRQPNLKAIGKPLTSTFIEPEAYSPNEVLQIAATSSEGTTLKGAIRQVVTANESFIEVQNQQGLRHRISHIGEGNAALKQGEVVYQDLAIQENMYVPEMSKLGDTLSSSYVVDSAGTRIARKIPINDPNLLHTATAGLRSELRPTFIRGKEFPAYSQQVDAGQFFTEDIAANNFDNLRVIVENNRKFVVGEKNGSTYRVSPVQVGDIRLGNNEVHEIAVNLIGQSLKPVESGAENVMASTLHKLDATKGLLKENASYSTSQLENLVTSRVMLNAKRATQIREELNKVRQKQGIV